MSADTSRQSYTIDEFRARHGGLSRDTIYKEIAAGRLRTFKVGRRRLISKQGEAEWQERLEAAARGGAK